MLHFYSPISLLICSFISPGWRTAVGQTGVCKIKPHYELKTDKITSILCQNALPPLSTYINKPTIARAKINFCVCCQDFSVTTVYTLTQQAEGLMTVNPSSALCSIKTPGQGKQKCAILLLSTLFLHYSYSCQFPFFKSIFAPFYLFLSVSSVCSFPFPMLFSV